MINIEKKSLSLKLYSIMQLCFFFKELVLTYTNITDALPYSYVSILRRAFMFLFIIIGLYLSICKRKYTVKEWIIIVAISMCAIISAYYSGTYLLLEMFMLLVCSKGTNYDEINDKILKGTTILIIVVAIMALLGIIDIGIKYRNSSNIVRYAMGFDHPNTLGIITFQWICQYIYKKRNNLKMQYLLLCFCVSVASYLITNSTTSMLLSLSIIAFCLLYSCLKGIKIPRKTVIRGLRIAFIACVAGVIYIVRYYMINPSELNLGTLQSRFILANKYINAYGIHLFGSEIEQGGNISIPGYREGYFFLDNGYIWMVLKYGVLMSGFFFVAIIKYIQELFKKTEWISLVIISAYLLYGLAETKAFMLQFNIFLLNMGILLFERKKSNEGIKGTN